VEAPILRRERRGMGYMGLEKGLDRVNIAREHMYIIVHIKWGVAQELIFYIRS